MIVLFDVVHLYYLPQYLPICEELLKRGAECEFVFYCEAASVPVGAVPESCLCHYVSGVEEAELLYLTQDPSDWVIFGNGFEGLPRLKKHVRTAMVYHGAGTKISGYAEEINIMDVRFVEGAHHFDALRRLYFKSRFVLAGFAKLDPLLNGDLELPKLEALGLDPSKPTLLYAPTFYPSSIELMAESMPQELSAYNLVIKLHHFSYNSRRYRKQLQRAQHWAMFDNVYLVPASESSILPYLGLADLLISEASSTLFEFAALDKPVVWCDFLKLRWNYRGIFSYRFKKRMDQRILKFSDIAAHAASYRELKGVIDQQIAKPEMFQAKRQAYTDQLLGPLDGKASQRIADYLMAEEAL